MVMRKMIISLGDALPKNITLMQDQKKYIKKMERTVSEVIGDALLNTPTAKTVNTSTYLHYITYILLNLNRIFEFNGCITIKYRFYLYQGVQRARAEMTDILLDGSRKYNKRKRKNTKIERKDEVKRS